MKLEKTKRGFVAVLGHKRVPLGTSDEAEAKRLAKLSNLEGIELAHKAQLLTAHAIQRLTFGKRVTAGRALLAFKEHLPNTNLAPLTIVGYTQRVERFLEGRMNTPINTIGERCVDAYVNPKDKVGVGTRLNRRNALLCFFKFCADKGFILGNPAGLVDVRLHDLTHTQLNSKKKPPVFDVDTTDMPMFWQVAVALAKEHGLRLSDVAGLEWASLAVPGQLIIYPDKTRRKLVLSISEDLKNVINGIPRLDPDLVFPDEWEISRSPTRRAALSTTFKRMTGVGFHQLRAGCATRMADRGDNILDIKNKLGHSCVTTTQGYIRPCHDQK